jgi:hypothetical protein
MHVRLTRKLANCLDGVDVSAYKSGDLLEVTRREAELLIAEGWATPVDPGSLDLNRSAQGDGSDSRQQTSPPSTGADDHANRVREAWEWPGRTRFDERDLRRSEDIIRDELRDSRARTVRPDKS